MHTYIAIRAEGGDYHYVVGFAAANNHWQPLKDCKTEREAANWVSFLNGGEAPDKPWPAEVI
jgi:hypothetical protein